MRASGVAVVTICPGYVATPMTARNPYRMPFLMRADVAAAKMARAIDRRKRFYVLPWPMAIAGRVLRALPRPLYDALFANAARKPRGDDVPHAPRVDATMRAPRVDDTTHAPRVNDAPGARHVDDPPPRA